MKAVDVIEQYKKGERNFRGKNLRGANFKGQDLSGADFSDCQIQSANFSEANLTETDFTGAKAGLNKKWKIFSLVILLLLVSGICSVIVGYLIAAFCLDFKEEDVSKRIGGIISLIILLIFLISTIQRNLKIGSIFVAILAFLILFFCLLVVAPFFGNHPGDEALIATIALIVAIIAGVEAFLVTLIISKIRVARGLISFLLAITMTTPFLLTEIAVRMMKGDELESYEQRLGFISLSTIVAIVVTISSYWISYRTFKKETIDFWLRKMAIFIASIGGTSFNKAILTDANFTEAILKNTNFNQAILTRTCFQDTVKLNLARPGKTLLVDPKVRNLLINPSRGQEQDLTRANLRGANLKEANLQRANLKQADISEASFQYANLSHANLTEVNAVYTNFSDTCFTGACLQNWNIDSTTKLDNIDCQYIFLLEHFNEHGSRERRPSSGSFEPGDFTNLFKQVFDTVDLIFENGIDWKAFIETIQAVQVQNEDTPLEVASIENKGNGVLVVKVKVPPDANKEKIHQDFTEMYQLKLEAVEAKYKAILEAKETEITVYRQQSIDMMEIVKTQASRPINIEAKAMTNSSDSSKNINIRDINNSGVLNLGEIIGDVNNTINQISETNEQRDELKTLLKALMEAIEKENELDEDEKADAANKVKILAQASQNPEDQGLQKKATRAVKLLETLAKGLDPATQLATACKTILPRIITFLGITL